MPVNEGDAMPTVAEFSGKVRAAIATLRALADEAGTVTGTTPDARDEAAEFLRIAADHCEDAIRALSDTP